MTERDKRDDDTRTDAAGYDITPPPLRPDQHSENPGLHDEVAPAQEGWREFDTERDPADWKADEPYPETPDAEEATLDDLPDLPEGDLSERIITLLEDSDLTISDLSVERKGTTIILRGTAETNADRARAVDLAVAVPGVDHVENLLAADHASDSAEG
ncbi:BON domain-containing protein [Halodurantibacterium flavum]|uniref:BON domain-containing protein n=1 Tax=Halodurantibacterium flavum TaxID=1382802 RepID=A0ABW4S6Y1_9RHOB